MGNLPGGPGGPPGAGQPPGGGAPGQQKGQEEKKRKKFEPRPPSRVGKKKRQKGGPQAASRIPPHPAQPQVQAQAAQDGARQGLSAYRGALFCWLVVLMWMRCDCVCEFLSPSLSLVQAQAAGSRWKRVEDFLLIEVRCFGG